VVEILSGVGTRANDFFARFGGEEFVLVLPQTDDEAAKKIAERCRKLIFKAQIPHAKSLVSTVLTISVGVGTVIPGYQDEPVDFINSVDQQLYQAKQLGRNCIVSGA
jgi:diguanylate cyclase (GGDEF)-like protein